MHRDFIKLFLVIIISSVSLSCSEQQHEKQTPRFENKNTITSESKRVELYKPEIIRQFPHDNKAFTQGLIIYKGNILESTGERGFSTLREVDFTSGDIIRKVSLADKYFGEGIAIQNEKLFFLTWTSQICFVYNPDSFEEINTFTYFTQGWGLTYYHNSLVMSDGSSYLRIIDPETFDIMKTLFVKLNGKPVENLNELELANGKIYANIWGKDYIVIINPETGEVEGKVDLSELRALGAKNPQAEVLNGIAFNEASNTFIVTGKNWDYYFEIKLKKMQ